MCTYMTLYVCHHLFKLSGAVLLVNLTVLQWNPSIMRGHHRGMKFWPLYIEGWPYLRGFVLCNILNGDAIGTKVSGHYREGGRSSGVVIIREFHCI